MSARPCTRAQPSSFMIRSFLSLSVPARTLMLVRYPLPFTLTLTSPSPAATPLTMARSSLSLSTESPPLADQLVTTAMKGLPRRLTVAVSPTAITALSASRLMAHPEPAHSQSRKVSQ